MANDDFGDFQQIAPTSVVQFDAFGTNASPAPQQVAFDAFNTSSRLMNNTQGMNTMNDVFGKMSLQSQKMPSAPVADNADDFGDFEDADPSSAKTPQKSADPLSKLISLDGLAKNSKKEDKLSQPVVFNDAAAQYVQNQQMNPHGFAANNALGSQMKFQGIDGLGHTSDLSVKGKPPSFR